MLSMIFRKKESPSTYKVEDIIYYLFSCSIKNHLAIMLEGFTGAMLG